MFRNRSVDVHQFAMVPRAEIPRSSFDIQTAHKTTFDAGVLVPIYVDEVLPGDSFNLQMTAFCRLATPIFPVMDNLHLDSFFFFIPYRLVWANFKKFMGEQDNPGDSISYTVPQTTSPIGGYTPNTIFDYMGLPTIGQVGVGNSVSHSCLPLRAYSLVWNAWFRDENLQQSVGVSMSDGPDPAGNFSLLRRGKRHDYFTSCLPWPQKGGTAVTIPLGTSAPVLPTGNLAIEFKTLDGTTISPLTAVASSPNVQFASGVPSTTSNLTWQQTRLFADLSQATAATINQLRQSFQVQKLLERDARGGTRYTEIVRSHFGVVSPDARLQRPEYLGGGSTPITINPVAQTSGSPGAGGYTNTPMGTLAAIGTAVAGGHGFSSSFTEHGIILGLVSVRADLTYQQGLRKMWSRQTRYDFYFPAFAMLGEQAVATREIYCDGSANDATVFGYQARWDEYRYHPSMITGLFKSTTVGTIDPWHLAQRFVGAPTLSPAFIEENPPVERIVAVGAAANGQQFLFDSFFRIRAARPLPMHSVPGLIDHF